MLVSKSVNNKKGHAVFVSNLSNLILPNWAALGFEGLPTYQALSEATGVNPRTIKTWMQREPFAQLDSETAGAFIRFLSGRGIECVLTDIVEIEWRDTPLRSPSGKQRGRKPKADKS